MLSRGAGRPDSAEAGTVGRGGAAKRRLHRQPALQGLIDPVWTPGGVFVFDPVPAPARRPPPARWARESGAKVRERQQPAHLRVARRDPGLAVLIPQPGTFPHSTGDTRPGARCGVAMPPQRTGHADTRFSSPPSQKKRETAPVPERCFFHLKSAAYNLTLSRLCSHSHRDRPAVGSAHRLISNQASILNVPDIRERERRIHSISRAGDSTLAQYLNRARARH